MINVKITDILPSLPKTKKIVDTYHSYKGYALEYHHIYFRRGNHADISICHKSAYLQRKVVVFERTRNEVVKRTRGIKIFKRSILFAFVTILDHEVNEIFIKHSKSLNELLDTYILCTLLNDNTETENPFLFFSYNIKLDPTYKEDIKTIISENFPVLQLFCLICFGIVYLRSPFLNVFLIKKALNLKIIKHLYINI